MSRELVILLIVFALVWFLIILINFFYDYYFILFACYLNLIIAIEAVLS